MKSIIYAAAGPEAIGPYSQAIKANGFISVSGQLPVDPATGLLVGNTIALQTETVLKNLKAILTAAGSALSHVVKTTVFLTNIDDLAAVNEVYAHYFSSAPPARATVEVARLPKNAAIEIELIALE